MELLFEVFALLVELTDFRRSRGGRNRSRGICTRRVQRHHTSSYHRSRRWSSAKVLVGDARQGTLYRRSMCSSTECAYQRLPGVWTTIDVSKSAIDTHHVTNGYGDTRREAANKQQQLLQQVVAVAVTVGGN
jgi:hypothetical protein